MLEKIKNDDIDFLFEALLALKNIDEFYKFFDDICTVSEAIEMSKRLKAARMLKSGAVYTDISETTGTLKIGRVTGYNDGSAILYINYAWIGVILPIRDPNNTGPSGIDGQAINTGYNAGEIKNQDTWKNENGARFDFSAKGPWTWNNGKMPSLNNRTVLDWPDHLNSGFIIQ